MKKILLLLCLTSTVLSAGVNDYSYSLWLNGWRKNDNDKSADVFGIETNKYGFALDLSNFNNVKFGKLNNPVSYADALKHKGNKLRKLPKTEMSIEIELNGDIYRAKTCKAGLKKDVKRLSFARLWESGRYVQHFEFQELDFSNAKGKKLQSLSKLNIFAWPESLTFTLNAKPVITYQDGINKGVSGNGLCVINKPLTVPHSDKIDPENLTLECWVNIPEVLKQKKSHGWIICKNENEWEDGNFGFRMLGTKKIYAYLNIGGGRKNGSRVALPAHGFHEGWNHLAMTYDGKELKAYINGKGEKKVIINKKRKPGKGKLLIGQRADGHGKPVKALIDQVRIWNRALNANQIIAHSKKTAVITNKNGLVLNKDFENVTKFKQENPVWKNALMRIKFNGRQKEIKVKGNWTTEQNKHLTLTYNIAPTPKAKITISSKGKNFPVRFEPEKNCYSALVKNLKRSYKTGYTDIRDYDEFKISVTGNSKAVPFLLDMRSPANVVGVYPLLCHEDGRPTGIPVQLSKNWHYREMGAYLMAYAMLPPGKYLLRIVNSFYGKYPSATHSNLSLVGYGGNGRWEQLAIGSWGETICFDADLSCVPNWITDIRLLMARTGKNGKKWGWTDAGWGGDWLNIQDRTQKKYFPMELKTSYVSQGPCLTDVRYNGYYGKDKNIDYNAKIQTLRTDDYSRTFQKMTYKFKRNVKAQKISLFSLTNTRPNIAYGNRQGLLKATLKAGKTFVNNLTLSGKAPFWVSFASNKEKISRIKANGYKALIIRKYKVIINGKTYKNPVISRYKYRKEVAFSLLPPDGIKNFKKGDSIELDLELITLHYNADDYYGPNELYRKHLAANPSSWKTTYREAIANDLKLKVSGGTIINNYPIAIKAAKPRIRVTIKGGAGLVPISFEGLKSTNYSLYQIVKGKEIKVNQSVHGNDFWQTEYDAKTKTYKFTYNLPLDGLRQSSWILKRN